MTLGHAKETLTNSNRLSELQCTILFGLSDLAQLYGCDESFLWYLLLRTSPLSNRGVQLSLEARSLSIPRQPFAYSERYMPILNLYQAIQKSGENIIEGKEYWFAPIISALSEYNGKTPGLDLCDYLLEYIRHMVALKAKALETAYSTDPKSFGREDKKSTITENTPWKVIPRFIELYENIILPQSIQLSYKEQEDRLIRFQTEFIDKIIAFPKTSIEDAKLREYFSNKKNKLLNTHPSEVIRAGLLRAKGRDAATQTTTPATGPSSLFGSIKPEEDSREVFNLPSHAALR